MKLAFLLIPCKLKLSGIARRTFMPITNSDTLIQEKEKNSTYKAASHAAFASFLNLTFLPVFSFIWLLLQRKQLIKNENDSLIAIYHNHFALKLNLIAAFFLVAVTTLMILLGGFNSAWTWVYVISYFTLVHSIFILIAVWALTRSWSGKKVFK